MKWVFLIGLLLFTPALSAYLRSNRNYLPAAAFALGLLPFIESKFNISASPIAWPLWQGTVKGIDISLTDAVVVAMFAASTARLRTPWMIKLAFGVFVLGFLVSTIATETRMPALFYGWQILRAALVYYAVARASLSAPGVPLALLTGLITGLATQAIVVTVEYAGGAPQAGGWFGHQNLLGMASHFIVHPAFAAFLGGYYRKRTALAVAAGIIVAFAGGSRATVGLLVVGLVLTAILSGWHRMTGRKVAFAVAALVGVLALSPLLYSAIERRSPEARAASNEERQKMEAAASMIVADYPLGVGANQYVVVANTGGYSARAGVAWNASNRSAPVHNSYYLVAAEMGWLGLLGFIVVLGSVLATAVKVLRRAQPSFGGEYTAGIVASFLLVAIHSYVEWITMSYTIHLLFAISLGVLVANHNIVARSKVKSTRSKRTGPRSDTTGAVPRPA